MMHFPQQARTDIEQLARVIQLLGSPAAADWPEVQQLPDYAKITFPPTAPAAWSAQFPADAPTAGVRLAAALVVYNPRRRLAAGEARRHEFVAATDVVPDGGGMKY